MLPSRKRVVYSLASKFLQSPFDRNDAIASISNNSGIILDKPKTPEYAILEKRRLSFKNWPKATGQDENSLAQAGFYYKGRGGMVTCFHCSLSVKDWSSENDPWQVHIKLFPYCAHVRYCKGDAYVLAELGLKESNLPNLPKNISKSRVELAISQNRVAYKAVLSIYSDENLVQKALEYLLQGQYNRSFESKELAKVIEDYWDGSVELFPKSEDSTEDKPDESEELDLDTLENENHTLKDGIMCKICFDDVASIVIVPCGHMTSCPQCISALKRCPLCRTLIQGSIRAMMA